MFINASRYSTSFLTFFLAFRQTEAAVILGPHGGAFYNILYAPRKTLVIEFFPVRPGSMLFFLPLPRQQFFFFLILYHESILRKFFHLVVLIIIFPPRLSTQVARGYLVACTLPRPALLPGTEPILHKLSLSLSNTHTHTHTHTQLYISIRNVRIPYFRTN